MNDLREFAQKIIDPSLQSLAALGGPVYSARAARFLLAIAYQESRCQHRAQIVDGGGKGPARGFWQFERRGGVEGVLTHRSSKALARLACSRAGVPPESTPVWVALEANDELACHFARLLIWTSGSALPGSEQAAWAYYLDTWRPGKPHSKTWPAAWRLACEAYPLKA